MSEAEARTIEVQEDEETAVPTAWEFMNEPPTAEELVKLLESLPSRWGVRPEKYVDFIQPLPQNKKMPQKRDERGRKMPDEYVTVFTLYVTVAGRIAMINDLAEEQDWIVDFEPEPITPTGIPGYLVCDEKAGYVVYREYVVIRRKDGSEVGRRSGTASVPFTGGSGAVASNRFEKVETSARGRAIGGWGIGVLPGSGVASYEEMVSSRREQNRPQNQQQEPKAPPISRPELDERFRVVLARYAQATDSDRETVLKKVISYAKMTFNKVIAMPAEGEPLNLTDLKDGELTIMMRAIEKQAVGAELTKQSLI